MKIIRGLTLEDVSAVALFGDPKAGWQTNQELEISVAKGRRFADSVLGRELFHRLPKHKCGKDCDTLTLLGAENFAFDRAYNPRAIVLFEQRFTNGSRKLRLEESYPEAYALGMRSDPSGYFTEWTDAFCGSGATVLHGETTPEELFGNGYLLELWETFSGYVKDVQG